MTMNKPKKKPSAKPFIAHKIAAKKLARRKAEKKIKKKKNWKKIILWTLGIFLSLFIALIAVGFVVIAVIIRDLPDVHDLDKFFVAESTQIFDKEGNLLYTVHGEENREVIEIFDRATGEIKPEYMNIVKATLAVEDDGFFEHEGFDIPGIIKAVCHETLGNMGGLCPQRGGSTITQQFIKMAFLTPERTVTRKIKELVLAVRLEQAYSKNEILELYLNKIPYGNNAYGIQMAAETYFNKNASELTIAESAILAGLPQAPSRYNPYGSGRDYLMGYYDETKLDPETGDYGVYVAGRKDIVLKRLADLEWITPKEKDDAIKEANNLEFTPYVEQIKHPHFVFYIRQMLEETYGADVVETGGLRVYTTLDPNLQNFAEELMKNKKEFFNGYGANNAALLSADPKTGQILTMVGSLDYWDEEIDGNVNVTMRPRLPGSSFKPYVYAAGFSQNYGTGTVLYDVRTKFGTYEPENYDGSFSGPVTVRRAIGHSLNIPAVKMGILAGIDNVLDLVKDMGINSLEDRRDQFGSSLALGAGEITMLEHVQGYSVFVNGGKKIPLTPFIRIEKNNGEVLCEWGKDGGCGPEKYDEEAEEVLDPQVAYEIVDVLSDSSARPGWSNRLSIPGQVAGWKTGTANKVVNNVKLPSDTWLMGFTPDIVTGVWAGNSKGEAMAWNATGATVSGPVWKEFMTEATKDKPAADFEKPTGLVWTTVSTLSGKLATEDTPEEYKKSELFASFAVPRETDDSVKRVKVDKITGLLPVEDCPEEALEERTFYNIHSIKPDDAAWEAGVQAWVTRKGWDTKSVPTEYTELCTPEYNEIRTEVPTISIVSPTELGVVSPGQVGVVVNVETKYGVDKVEFKLDGEVVNTVHSYPYKGTITIPDDTSKTRYTITATVYDPFANEASSQISVRTGEDRTEPMLDIVSPTQGENIEKGSSLTVITEAYDTQSDIKNVTFSLDGSLLGTREAAPYNLTFPVDQGEGMHTLSVIARDVYGNTKTKEVAIEIVKGSSRDNDWEGGDTAAVFLAPTSGTHLPAGMQATVSVLVNPNLNISEIEVVGQRTFEPAGANKKRVSIGSTSIIPDNGRITIPWLDPAYGDYELYIRSKVNGESQFTPRISVVVE